MIPENLPLSSIHGFLGKNLSRPECVLAHESGLLLVPNWSDKGGISLILPDNEVHHILGKYPTTMRPNGIALEAGGTVLLAHMGETDGGIFRLYPSGDIEPVALTVNGHPIPPTNFVVKDSTGRIWLTVSTRKTPRATDYRAGARSGFIAVIEPGSSDARIVADGLGYTNECIIDEERGEVWVNETFARRLTRFNLKHVDSAQVSLQDGRVMTHFQAGTYPDGLALDETGHVWVTSIVSNRIIRVSRDGLAQTMFEDSDADHIHWTESAYQNDSLGREHLDNAKSTHLKNMSNLAFGGADRKTLYLGNLLGENIPFINGSITGAAMQHWNVPLGDLTPQYR